jgi:hypothetical protein
MQMSKIVWVAIFVIVATNTITAQVEKIKIAGASFNLNTSLVFSKNMIDTAGNYSDRSVQFGFSIPVYQNIRIKENQELSLTIISVNSRNMIRNPQIDFLNYNQTVFAPAIGISLITSSGKKSFWLLSVNTSLSEDQEAILNPTIRYEGSGLYIRRVNPEFSYHLGLIYSCVFGREFIFPVIGLRKEIAEHLVFNCSLPMSMSLKYYYGDKNSFLSAYLRPNGGSILMGNGDQLFGLNEKLLMQNRQFSIGIDSRIKLHKGLFLTLDAGFLALRKLTFSKMSSGLRNEDSIYQTNIANTEFIQAGLVYRFFPNRYTNYLKNDEIERYQEY